MVHINLTGVAPEETKEPEMTKLISDLELAARSVLNPAQANDEKWSPARAAVLKAFRAMWANSLTSEKVRALASVMNGIDFPVGSIEAALTSLTREKVLRSRMASGRRFYEVAIPGDEKTI